MDKEIHRLIMLYKLKLEALGIKVKKIILYGSYAEGRASKDSDIDLLVVSDNFKDMDLWERLTLMGRARIGIKRPIEIIGVTEKEFMSENFGTFIGDKVKTKGIIVV